MSYDAAPALSQRALTTTFVSAPKQTASIIAAPLSSSGGYGQSNQVVTPIVQQTSSGYGQSNQIVAPAVEQSSSGYGQTSQVVAPVQQSNDGYGQQQQTVVQPVITQQTSSYSQQPVATVQSSYSQQPVASVQSSYSQQTVPVTTVQSSYGQQPAVQVVAPVSSSYGSYGQQSPMTLFMSQPAIQQLISTMVAQYHGNQLGVSQEMANTCSIGFTQPIYESNQVTETYCRCPTGTYGFTCTENFENPCMDGSVEFTAADSRVPSNYFLKCSWGIPYLNKCPMGTVRWSQELHACIAEEPAPQLSSSYGGGYSSGGYGQQQTLGRPVAPIQSTAYGQQTPVSFGNVGTRIGLSQSQTGGYGGSSY